MLTTPHREHQGGGLDDGEAYEGDDAEPGKMQQW